MPTSPFPASPPTTEFPGPAAHTATRADQWPGTGLLLSNRYRLDRFIASGAAASVWQAHDTQLARDVAIKLLLPHRAADEDAVERFRIEALATVRATHPNAVRVFDASTDGSLTFLVMELVDGPSLAGCRTPVEPLVAAALGAQVGAALGAAHRRGLVHRDVKPGNVLVDADGRVKVVDFGIARVLDAPSAMTLPNIGMGTARYVAPELLTGGHAGPWTDVYGLGLTLWESLVGRPAFAGDNVHALALARLEHDVDPVGDHVADVPVALTEAIARCTRRDPAARFPDGHTAAEAIQQVCGPRPHELTRRLLPT